MWLGSGETDWTGRISKCGDKMLRSYLYEAANVSSGQTHSRARSHQGDADLRADRSTAYLVSCIRVRSAHGNSFDHLVGEGEQLVGNLETERPRGLQVDHQLEFSGLLHREFDWLRATQNSVGILGSA